MYNLYVENIKKELTNVLPGQEAQYLMVPQGRIRTELDEVKTKNPKLAGVLLLLYPVNNFPHLVLMQRNSYPGVHSNQISFPGGKIEKSDLNIEATALRESHEEMGIIPAKVTVLGNLTQVYIPPSNFLVQPVVGFMQERPDFIPDLREVTEIIEVPLSEFDKAENLQNVKIDVRGQQVSVPAFVIRNKIIWGATAMILSEFLNLAKRRN